MSAVLTLFPYQQKAIENTRKFLIERRYGSGIIHLFTGGGKSVVAVELVKQVFPLDKYRVIFTAPSIELVYQMHGNFKQQWPDCQRPVAANNTVYPGLGIVMEKLDDANARLIVASMPTLAKDILNQSAWSKLSDEERDRVAALPPEEQTAVLTEMGSKQWQIDIRAITKADLCVDAFGNITKSPQSDRSVLVSERFDRILAQGGLPNVIITDEAHHALADGTFLAMKRLEQIADALHLPVPYLVGLTATPVREDQRGMGNLFKTMIISKDFRSAQAEGYLAPFAQPVRVMPPNGVPLKLMSNWAEFIVETWKEKAGDRPTVFFSDKMDAFDMGPKEASKALAAEFNRHGIPAVHLDDSSCIGPSGEREPKSQRRKYFKMVMEGKIKVITNFGIMIEGVDVPPISCVALLRKMNPVQLTQAMGRALRKFSGSKFLPEKKDMLLMDYTGDDLAVVPVGTLMGMKVDPTTHEFVNALPDSEEDELEDDGKALADVLADDDTVVGKDAVYSIPKIIAKSAGDWYHDYETSSMSLAVSASDVLVIGMPQHTMASNMQYLAEEAMNGGGDVPEFVALDDAGRHKWIEFFQWAQTLYGSFTLWHAKEVNGRYVSATPSWLAAGDALDVLEATAVQYGYHAIEEAVDVFVKKGAEWKKSKYKITEPQRQKLAEMLGVRLVDFNPDITKRDASKWISHLRAYGAVLKFFKVAEKTAAPFAKYMI